MKQIKSVEMVIRLAIIVQVYNRKNFTLSFLEQLWRQTSHDFRIIVVDDGSNDGTLELLSSYSSRLDVVRGDGTWWWTKSVNKGLKLAVNEGCSHVLLMNNDTFFEHDFIQKVIQHIKKYPDAVIGSLSVTNEVFPRIFFAGCARIINWKAKSKLYYPQFSAYSNLLSGIYFSVVLPGRGLIIPIDILKQIGFFNEKDLPQYLADFDWVRRAGGNGFKTLISYDLVVKCELNATGKGATYGGQSFFQFVASFFDRYSHHSIVANYFYLKRHCSQWEFLTAFLIDKCRVFYSFFRQKFR